MDFMALIDGIEIRDIVTVLGYLLGSGGLLGSVYLLIKLRPEARQITVVAAQGALIVQTGVIDALREEINRLNDKIDALEVDNDRLRARMRLLEGTIEAGGKVDKTP